MNSKSTPEVNATENTLNVESVSKMEESIRISPRTGKPVRTYRKTGASALIKEGISPRTHKPIRKYEKTGFAALVKQGISPRTHKPIRKYEKRVVKSTNTDANTISIKKAANPPKKMKKAKKIIREVVASDEA